MTPLLIYSLLQKYPHSGNTLHIWKTLLEKFFFNQNTKCLRFSLLVWSVLKLIVVQSIECNVSLDKHSTYICYLLLIFKSIEAREIQISNSLVSLSLGNLLLGKKRINESESVKMIKEEGRNLI